MFVDGGTGWTEEAKLTASDGTGDDWFGTSVSLAPDGTRALVGASHDDANRGSAYVFSRTGTTWAEEARLTAPVAESVGQFGCSVSLSSDGSRALVGAPDDDSGRGRAHLYTRSSSTWSREAVLRASDGAAGDQFGTAVSLSADGVRALVGAPGDDSGRGAVYVLVRSGTTSTWTDEAKMSAPDGIRGGSAAALSADGTRALFGGHRAYAGRGVAYVFRVSSVGSTCTTASGCETGFCVDGVCCDTACGGGTTDCVACDGALTGATTGICAALSATVAPTTTCRASASACDLAEVCVAGSATCPTDAVAGPGTVCRPPASVCDVPENCTGTSPSCPADGFAVAGTGCRGAAGACDAADTCTGTSASCPADAVRAAGTVCGLSSGDPCDVDDVCDGTSAGCTARFAVAGTVCDSTVGGACDAPDVCTGTSADCMPGFADGVECRPSTGACDPVEVCSGAGLDCPPDRVAPAGTLCRASSDLACDPLESCDGASAACPADVTSCADSGGPADGGAPDGGVPDAGSPATAAGCSCRSAGASRAHGVAVVASIVLLAVLRRRAR